MLPKTTNIKPISTIPIIAFNSINIIAPKSSVNAAKSSKTYYLFDYFENSIR